MVIKDILNTYETGLLLWIENNSGVMRIITQELWTKVQAKHGHYLIILDQSKSKEYTAIIKFIKPKTPIVLSRGAVTKKFQVAGYMQLVGGELCSKEVLLVLFSFCLL